MSIRFCHVFTLSHSWNIDLQILCVAVSGYYLPSLEWLFNWPSTGYERKDSRKSDRETFMECISRNFLIFRKPVYFADWSEIVRAPVIVRWGVAIEWMRALALFSPLILHQQEVWTMAPLETHNCCNVSKLFFFCVAVFMCCVCCWLWVFVIMINFMNYCWLSFCIHNNYNNYYNYTIIIKSTNSYNAESVTPILLLLLIERINIIIITGEM